MERMAIFEASSSRPNTLSAWSTVESPAGNSLTTVS